MPEKREARIARPALSSSIRLPDKTTAQLIPVTDTERQETRFLLPEVRTIPRPLIPMKRDVEAGLDERMSVEKNRKRFHSRRAKKK